MYNSLNKIYNIFNFSYLQLKRGSRINDSQLYLKFMLSLHNWSVVCSIHTLIADTWMFCNNSIRVYHFDLLLKISRVFVRHVALCVCIPEIKYSSEKGIADILHINIYCRDFLKISELLVKPERYFLNLITQWKGDFGLAFHLYQQHKIRITWSRTKGMVLIESLYCSLKPTDIYRICFSLLRL